MIEIFEGKRLSTDAFNRYKVSAGLLIGASASKSAAFEEDIRERHSFLSFQQPDKIADAVRNFYSEPLWRNVSMQLGIPEVAVKNHLRLIVDRRNKIAHEADADPSFPGERWPITTSDADNALSFVEKVCEAIYLLAK